MIRASGSTGAVVAMAVPNVALAVLIALMPKDRFWCAQVSMLLYLALAGASCGAVPLASLAAVRHLLRRSVKTDMQTRASTEAAAVCCALFALGGALFGRHLWREHWVWILVRSPSAVSVLAAAVALGLAAIAGRTLRTRAFAAPLAALAIPFAYVAGSAVEPVCTLGRRPPPGAFGTEAVMAVAGLVLAIGVVVGVVAVVARVRLLKVHHRYRDC